MTTKKAISTKIVPQEIIQSKIFYIRGKKAYVGQRLGRALWCCDGGPHSGCKKKYQKIPLRFYVSAYETRVCGFEITFCDIKRSGRYAKIAFCLYRAWYLDALKCS